MGISKIKKCIVCGEIFIPYRGKQVACSDECCKKYKSMYNTIKRWDLMNAEYLGAGAYIKEESRGLPPNLEDRIKVKMLLEDFGVNEEIPWYGTWSELNNWKNEQIQNTISYQ